MQQLTLFSLSTVPTTWVKFYCLWRGEFSLISQTTHGKLTKYQCKYHLFSPEGQYAYSCETTAYSIEKIERDFRDTIDQLISDLLDTQVAPQQFQHANIDACDAPNPDYCVGEQVTTPDTVNLLVGEQVTPATEPDTVNLLVGEQVTTDTKKTAPQHDATHWVEEYWVERSGNKYWYYRYMYMTGRKIHRIYIGSVMSVLARRKKAAVESAIADGQTPSEIKKLIHSSH